ncbi:hypothetical protein LOC67_02665 [Stieleria sp. JC731]|uniref:hypothetical protein n=1 Tax=Pirellulaceae TaxID=2691357 RepID=UPI001E5AB584|nr:hypothetical protein [Stieleria sp. JC731]MCC9599448.1 hypothetical protein [Stieleria sp. JC731]
MSEQSNTESAKQSNPARSAILYVVLALMVVALIYDYKVARPAVSADYDKVTEASTAANRVANDFLTNMEVRELLGKEPNETFEDGPETVEVFKYMGGLIVKPHRLYVVYRKSGDELMFSRHSKFAYDESSAVGPTEAVVIVNEDGDDEDAQYDAESGGGAAPAGPPAGGGSGGPPAAAGGGGPQDSSAYRPQPEEAPAEEAPAADDSSEESTDSEAEKPAEEAAE